MGHRGGINESTLWALKADLNDAFCDDAPEIEVVLDADMIQADVVVMLAGKTISTDPSQSADRSELGVYNKALFAQYATSLGNQDGHPPVVVVQSNPVELGVKIFADALGRHRVLGAGAWSDTLRFRTELARSLKIRRTHVQAWALGQHGDHLVPCRSQVNAWGVADRIVEELREHLRNSHSAQS